MTNDNNDNALEELDSRPKRVAYAIENSDVPVTEIAFKMGLGEGTIWRWKKLDKSNFKDREVHKLAKITGFSADWILYGEGPMYVSDQLNRIKSVKEALNHDYKGRDQIVSKVARRLKSLAQELLILGEDLDGTVE